MYLPDLLGSNLYRTVFVFKGNVGESKLVVTCYRPRVPKHKTLTIIIFSMKYQMRKTKYIYKYVARNLRE